MSLVEDRFWAKVIKAESCWEWTGCKTSGYGQFRYRRIAHRAHRFSYEMAKGPIPEGLVIDHICRNKACVNPDHLEAVTQRENLLRAPKSVIRVARSKTSCKRGHPFDAQNTRIRPNGSRLCRRCEYTLRRYWRAYHRLERLVQKRSAQ